MSQQSFRELGVSARVIDALAARSIHEPFRIQSLVLPDALAGLDVLAKSPTGSGKTLAFAIPIVERTTERDKRPVRARARPDARARAAGRRGLRADRAGERPTRRRRLRGHAAPRTGGSRPRRARRRRDARPPSGPRRAAPHRPERDPHPRPRRGRPHARHGLQAAGRPDRAPVAEQPSDDVLLGDARRRGRRARARVHEQPVHASRARFPDDREAGEIAHRFVAVQPRHEGGDARRAHPRRRRA